MEKIIETDRLILRRFDSSDAPQMYLLNADPTVLKYTGDLPFQSISEAESFIQHYDHYQKYGFGRWSVILKSSNEFIGWCGLKQHEEAFVDIGFRFFKKEWGKGYATEAAKACLVYGFEYLNLKEIIGRAAKENIASVRVLEKLGMEFWKEDTCEGIDGAVYYRLPIKKNKI